MPQLPALKKQMSSVSTKSRPSRRTTTKESVKQLGQLVSTISKISSLEDEVIEEERSQGSSSLEFDESSVNWAISATEQAGGTEGEATPLESEPKPRRSE